MPSRRSDRRVVSLALPGVQPLDLFGPMEVFDAATRWLRARGDARPGYRCVLVGPQRELTTGVGVVVVTEPLRSLRGPLDTVLVGGAPEFIERTFEPAILRWLRRRAARARRVASICTGAFVLAEAGLLDGRRATTHWMATEQLRARFPEVTVEADALYVEDGPIHSSAGVTAGIDLALALVERDLGHEAALAVAQGLVMFLHRPGGQSQFSAALKQPTPSHAPLRRVRAEVLERPAGDHRVEGLARRAGMSPRHFARVFAEQTGETPARFVQRVRVERARSLLEQGGLGVDAVAEQVGFGSAETMRRAFMRVLGVGPSSYRARFHASGSG
nr:helix-turn-helix domain-containing protein [Plesiocystis pacifica]